MSIIIRQQGKLNKGDNQIALINVLVIIVSVAYNIVDGRSSSSDNSTEIKVDAAVAERVVPIALFVVTNSSSNVTIIIIIVIMIIIIIISSTMAVTAAKVTKMQ